MWGALLPPHASNFASDDMPFDMTRHQFPFKPAFALTINKSQGQTLKEVGLYLPDPVFSHGQLRVAFSRVSSLEHIQVLIENTKKQKKLVPLQTNPVQPFNLWSNKLALQMWFTQKSCDGAAATSHQNTASHMKFKLKSAPKHLQGPPGGGTRLVREKFRTMH